MEFYMDDSITGRKKPEFMRWNFAEKDLQRVPRKGADQNSSVIRTVPEVPVLGDELWGKVFEYAPVFDLLQHVALVCHQFLFLLRRKYFWHSYGQVLANATMWQIYKNNQNWSYLQLQQVCAFATWKPRDQQSAHPCLLEECLLPTTREALKLLKSSRRACLASNTHHGTTESIEYTLSPAPRRAFSNRPVSPGWWSSPPASSRHDSFENLLYLTSYPLSYVTRVRVKPLVDSFRGILQVYSWQHTKITAYLLPMSLIEHAGVADGRQNSCSVENNAEQSDNDTMEALLKDQAPVYESPKLACPTIVPKLRSDDESQWVSHDLPAGVVANAVFITLYGKTARESLGYYACVDQVKIEGIPILVDRTALVRRMHQRRSRPWWNNFPSESSSGSNSGSGSGTISDSDSGGDDDSMTVPAGLWDIEDIEQNGMDDENDSDDDDDGGSIAIPADIAF